jgi:hypothetical protein
MWGGRSKEISALRGFKEKVVQVVWTERYAELCGKTRGDERRRLLNADSTSCSVPSMIEKGHLEAEGKGNMPHN